VFAVLAAPLVELATGRGQDAGKCCLLSGAHQSVLLEKGLAGPPGDPFHEPPIKRNLPATTDDTSQNQSFHAPLPKGHVLLTQLIGNTDLPPGRLVEGELNHGLFDLRGNSVLEDGLTPGYLAEGFSASERPETALTITVYF